MASPTVDPSAAAQRYPLPSDSELDPDVKIVVWSGRNNEAWKPEQQAFPRLTSNGSRTQRARFMFVGRGGICGTTATTGRWAAKLNPE